MEKNAFETQIDIYNQYDFTTETDFMNNRLFATFTQQNLIEGLLGLYGPYKQNDITLTIVIYHIDYCK